AFTIRANGENSQDGTAALRMRQSAAHGPPGDPALRAGVTAGGYHRAAVHAAAGFEAGARRSTETTGGNSWDRQYHPYPQSRPARKTWLAAGRAGNRSPRHAARADRGRREKIPTSSAVLAVGPEAT